MVKRIVICCDGTWATPRQANPTNVIQFARAVSPTGSDGMAQLVFYDPGVGTESGWRDKLRGGVLGKGLDRNIEDAYRFLALNYETNDQIYLVGFSRGAYTARSLAGLLRNCGLLRKIHLDKFSRAFALYQSRDGHPNSPEAEKFRSDFSQEAVIKFIGVWDTVGAMGIPVGGRGFAKKRYQFHDVKLSGRVQNAYHALSIDETRKPFEPSLWETNAPGDGASTQNVEQVWFAGVHSDVGGGYTDHRLADHAFAWLQEKAERCDLTFDRGYLDQHINADSVGETHDSMSFIYKLLSGFRGGLIRPLGLKLNEAVHPGVLEKYEAQGSTYRPKNLEAYLARDDHKVAQFDSLTVTVSGE